MKSETENTILCFDVFLDSCECLKSNLRRWQISFFQTFFRRIKEGEKQFFIDAIKIFSLWTQSDFRQELSVSDTKDYECILSRYGVVTIRKVPIVSSHGFNFLIFRISDTEWFWSAWICRLPLASRLPCWSVPSWRSRSPSRPPARQPLLRRSRPPLTSTSAPSSWTTSCSEPHMILAFQYRLFLSSSLRWLHGVLLPNALVSQRASRKKEQ